MIEALEGLCSPDAHIASPFIPHFPFFSLFISCSVLHCSAHFSHLLWQSYFLPVRQFADKLCFPHWWESSCCVCACMHTRPTSCCLISAHSHIWWRMNVHVWDRKAASFWPLASYVCKQYLPVCVCVSACVNVCDPPVVTVLKSKLTSPSPCNSICPSARPLGGYREREHRGGRWRRSES